MMDVFAGLFWFALFLAVVVTVAYRRFPLNSATFVIGGALLIYSMVGSGSSLWFLILWLLFGAMVALNFIDFRRENLTARLFDIYKAMVPAISDTEREALLDECDLIGSRDLCHLRPGGTGVGPDQVKP